MENAKNIPLPFVIENGIRQYNFKRSSEEALLLKTTSRQTRAVARRTNKSDAKIGWS